MKFNYKTVTRKILADLYTPVGVYMRLRDIYPQSALMESSDYHGSENSRSFIGVHPLVSEISHSNNNFLPVLDQAGVLLGVIDITKIRHIIFRTELYQHFTVRQLMMQPSAVLTEHDSMDEVMQKFDKTDTAQLPVVDVAGVLKGYISRTRIYSMYRQIVADMSAE
jgi:chloride channel protein, CIC family